VNANAPPISPVKESAVPGWVSGTASAILLVGGLVLSTGCSRSFYREQADFEAYSLIGRGAQGPGWELTDYSIEADSKSRMHDPNCPNWPPMPTDDPISHQLMQCVDGKRGSRAWERYGTTPFVENPYWLLHLPYDDEGNVVLDRESAVLLARLHSRRYQSKLEDLYLSALDVSFQQFRFDAQFFGGYSTFFTADGPDRAGGPSSLLAINSDMGRIIEMRKQFATGTELVAGMANSLVWQFAGPDEYSATSLLDFSLAQPLLRGAGRAVVLESLTDAERALLANIRQMERFRCSFYVNTVTGRTPDPGPSRSGIGLGTVSPGAVTGSGGLLALMEQQVRIRNQRANVAGLRESLDQLDSAYEAGRIDRLQVDQARQALYNAQSRLLSLKKTYQDRLDAYKVLIGLPPGLPIKVEDPLLGRFDLIDPRTTDAQDRVADLLLKLRDPDVPPPDDLAGSIAHVTTLGAAALELLKLDMQELEGALPKRQASLRRLAARPELRDGDVERTAVSIEGLNHRVARLRDEFRKLQAELSDALVELEPYERPEAADSLAPRQGEGSERSSEELIGALRRLGQHLASLALVQAWARLDTVTLTPIELPWQDAVETARRNRLDWMNARAALVDRWRRVEIAANALRGDLDVTFSGDLATTDNNPLKFRSTTGRLRVGLRFDAPLTRLVERNAYRETLIDYDRARREYYAYEDGVVQTLRETLRTIQLNQLDFEIAREGVQVAISQVEITQLRLQRPPKPGEEQTFGATTARDLVQALSGLLNAQDSFLNLWVNYEVQRMNLDLDLGTMRLDDRGLWLDPGEVVPGATRAAADLPAGMPGMVNPDLDAEPDPVFEEIPIPPGVPLPGLPEP
jgi:outer membrane protein TolC